MKNSDKPAYPTIDTIHPETGQRFEPLNTGLTKREMFAMAAMQGILSSSADRGEQYVALASVEFADELLKQLGE